jgi:hypothetical protein
VTHSRSWLDQLPVSRLALNARTAKTLQSNGKTRKKVLRAKKKYNAEKFKVQKK